MRGVRGLLLFLAVSVSSSLFLSSSTQAFTGHGAGTSGSPYRIASCAQLQEINNDLSAYYVLVSNINCNGFSFTHLGTYGGTTFTGTLDGRNHRITNLNPDDYGLFGAAYGAVIKNIKLEGGSVTGSWVGSFAAYAAGSALTNLHSNMTVNSSGSYSGGLVGEITGPTYISKSSFSGTLNTGPSYNGGLVGRISNPTSTVFDSYSTGTINAVGPYMGGIVGGFFNGSVSKVYSSSAIDGGGNSYIGGVSGATQNSVSDSFSAVSFTNAGANIGGVIGANNSGSYSNNYYDQYLAGTANCYGSNAAGACTAVNASNTTPNYFKNNSTNGPFSAWDFTDVWQVGTSYPTLKKEALFESPAVPNLGDANGDSTDDSFQPYVGSVSDTDGKFSTVTVPSSGGCTLDAPTSTTRSSLVTDSGYTPLMNLTGFTLYCPSAGSSVAVTIIYDKVYDTSNAVLRQYNPSTQTYKTISGANFGTTPIGSTQKTTVTYTLTDGGVYDQDGTANGVIVDPILLANAPPAAAAPNTGLAPISAVTAASILAGGTILSTFGMNKIRKRV
jgi:hypothetical protein